MIGSTISFYLARHFVGRVIFTFLLFLGLIIAIDLIELSRELSRVDGVVFADILSIAALRAPAFAENVLPFTILFGAAVSLMMLNRRLELVVARASGVSVWQFLLPLFVMALTIGAISILLYNPLSLWAQAKSRAAEAQAFGNTKGGFSNKSRNFWVRLPQPEGDAIIRARVAQDGGETLTAVTVHRFNESGESVERLDANNARFVASQPGQNHYLLEGVTAMSPGERGIRKRELLLPVNISLKQLQASMIKPSEISFFELGDYAEQARKSGRNELPYVTQFQALATQPFLFAAMVLVAATFSLRFARFGQSGPLILGGILAGFMVYVASRLVLTFGSNGLVPAPLAVWSPVLVASLIAATVLLYQEDG